MSHTTILPDVKPGSSGVTVPNTESLIVDDEGRALGVDEVGQLLVRGPQVMAGYLNNPAATAETVDADGWLHTGDLARIDADGHLFIVGRVKELIKYNGFQVAPAELEAVLLEHPDVADAAVIGVPDVQVGEIPTAFVVTRPGHRLTSQDAHRPRRRQGRDLQADPTGRVRGRDPQVGRRQDPAPPAPRRGRRPGRRQTAHLLRADRRTEPCRPHRWPSSTTDRSPSSRCSSRRTTCSASS